MNAFHVALSLGSNLGDRLDNLLQGTKLLEKEIIDLQSSSVYESQPVGPAHQSAFLNMAAVGETDLLPLELLEFVKGIEYKVGRRPTYRWGPRVLDIDILLLGDQVVRSPELTIPHPEFLRRGFAVIPLCEVEPDILLADGRHLCEEAIRLKGCHGLHRWVGHSGGNPSSNARS